MFYLNMMVDYPFYVLLSRNYLGHLSDTQGYSVLVSEPCTLVRPLRPSKSQELGGMDGWMDGCLAPKDLTAQRPNSPFPFCLQLLAQTLDLDLALGFSIKSTIHNMVSISTYFLFVAKKNFQKVNFCSMKLNCKQQTPCKISGIKICQACFKTSQKFNWKVQFKLETYITHEIEMEQGRNQNRVTTTVLACGDFHYLPTIFEHQLMNGQISVRMLLHFPTIIFNFQNPDVTKVC